MTGLHQCQGPSSWCLVILILPHRAHHRIGVRWVNKVRGRLSMTTISMIPSYHIKQFLPQIQWAEFAQTFLCQNKNMEMAPLFLFYFNICLHD